MRRTYKSKKETDGTIDPRDVLLTLDAKSSVFDAFYIQNIKQTKRDMSVASTTQFAASNKVRKRKYVKRLKEQEALFQPRESTSRTAFWTPDKSFRVNKAPDLFDQLLNSSCNEVKTQEPVNLLRKQPAFQKKTYIKRKPKKKNINYSNSDSSDSDKENFNSREEAMKTPNTSDIKSHKLIIEKEIKSSPKYIDESINNIVNNLSIFTHNKNQSVATPNNENYNVRKQAQLFQTSPLCSTPFLKKYRGGSIYRFSPISINQDDSPKCVTVMENSKDYSTDDPNIPHKEIIKVNDYKIDKLIIKEAAIKENIQQSIVPEEKYEYNNTFEITNQTNTAASVIYDIIDGTDKTEIQSPILSNQTVNSNKREPRKLATYLSYVQNTEIEPFHGFEDIDLLGNDKLYAITNKFIKMENGLDDNSYKRLSPTKLPLESTFVNTNQNSVKDKEESAESNTSSAAESSESDLFYDTCNSNDSIEEQVQKNESKDENIEVQVQNIEPLVVVERLNDSVFEKYYLQMANYSVESHDLHPSSDSNDYSSVSVSEGVSNKSYNNSTVSENSTEDDSFNISIGDEENNESIGSNEIDYSDNSIESKPEDVCVSFVTTRRRNEIRNGSFIGLDNSNVSTSSREFDKTVLTNKNSLEYTNYVTLEEDVLDNIYETFNIEEEFDKNRTDYKCSNSESDELSKVDSPPKGKNILTRKIAQESIKVNKSKSPAHKLPKTYDDADGSFNLKAEEIDQHGTEYRGSISESNEITETKLTLKVKKKNMRKSARKTSEARKPKSPFDNERKSLNIVTRKSSKMYRNSIATECRNSSGYEDNRGNNSLSCGQSGIILQPGKRWERSLSIYRRMTTMVDQFDHSILDEEQSTVRKYRQSVITTSEIQDLEGSFHNDSINSRRSTFVSKPSRSTIKIVRESNSSRASICSTVVCEDLEGFLGEDCDDTIVELSKLSIADSQHEVTIIEKFHDTSNRRTTARDYVLRRCNQADVLPFDECYPDPVLKNCRKIGEGVYGEVFLWRAGDGRARVLKVIPIAGNIKVNGEQQKDFHEIISEIVIAMELSALRAPIADIEQHLNEGKSLETLDLHSVENATDAFNEVLRVRCVSGSYPSRLLELWELYDECRGSENDSPATLPPHQQYIVLELGNAGEDLESYQFNNAEQAYALFKQIAFGLAVAEEAYQFEHRDLHWGNVLISPTEEKHASFVVRGRLHRVRRAGVRASVIDYSLSRATLGRCALYNDLAHDDALFDALGDYQFQLYRLMRDKLGNDWKNFEPYTNVLWLHYTVDKMITALRYTRTNTKIHKHYIAKLKEIKNRILDYGSAVQYVLTDNEL